MARPWQIMAATDYEEIQLLKAATNTGPDVPASYYAGVSTTRPTKAGAITELTGNNYARVQIPAWEVAGPDLDGAITDLSYASPAFSAVTTHPINDLIFPTPSASWWTNGATVYLFLADASTGGQVRWWMPIAPAMAPNPALPLLIPANQLLIGIAIQAAFETGAARQVGVLAAAVVAKALDRMTGVDPAYAPTYYLSAGWGDWFDVNDNFISHNEMNAARPASWGYAVPGFDYNGGGSFFGSGQVQDAAYVRKSVAWAAPVADADGWYVANNAAITWTLGDNTVVSGTPIPPEPYLGQQLAWSDLFRGLGFRSFLSDTRGSDVRGGAFALWQQTSGGKGGPPPQLIPSPFTDATYTSGLKDSGGDIWGYPYFPSEIVPARVPSVWVVQYEYVDSTQIQGVHDNGDGTFAVFFFPGYSRFQFFVIYEQQGDGSWRDPVSGTTLDQTTIGVDFLAWGTAFPPAGGNGGLHFYATTSLADDHYPVVGGGVHSDDTGIFAVGDQVTVDAGALKLRLR